ncbi:hypothetical protein F5B21DRAFT_504282 [Xylaria acuta]|nr:hypothetical protein F5B21DRAFT_504282 [Xylaria acuta]
MVSSSHELHLLKSNAVLVPPTDEEPCHQISMTNNGCTISIAATKPFPVPIHIHPLHPDFKEHKPKPAEWVSITHKNRCECAIFSRQVPDFFEAWRHIHLTLRYKSGDNASYAFYPEFEYEVGEALAHASLTASLALGKPIPSCYEYLIKDFGTPKLRIEAERIEAERQAALDRGQYDSDGDSDGDYDGDDSDDSSVNGFDWSSSYMQNLNI